MKQTFLKIAVIVAVPLVIAAVYTLTNKPAEKAKTEETQKIEEVSARGTNPTIIEGTIEPSITITRLPTQTPTVTEKPVEPTKTIVPTPTDYIKNLNPTSDILVMENEVCKVFGEKDCNAVVGTAKQRNYTLSAIYYNGVPKRYVGVFAMDCQLANVQKAYNTSNREECVNVATQYKVNINAAKIIYDSEGLSGLRKSLGYF